MRKTLTNMIRGFATIAAVFAGSIALAASPVLVCGLTGKKATACCCAQKGGKIVCNSTGKAFDKCCCTVKPNSEPKK